MTNAKDLFSKLKTSILGTKTVKIDNSIDKIVQDISAYRSNSGRLGYIDLVRSLIVKATSSNNTENTLLSQSDSTIESFGQANRLARYKIYESICGNISYCKRALHVLTDNILSPDDITKVSLDIKPKTYNEDTVESESKVKQVRKIIKEIKLEKYLSTIIKDTLKLGDFFCEVADSKTALTSRAILAEQNNPNNSDSITSIKEQIIFENLKTKEEIKKDIDIKINYLSYHDESDKSTKNNIKKLYLVFHEPNRVLKLQSEAFPLCFGYLIFPKVVAMSPFLQPQDQAINTLCNKIIQSLEDQIPNFEVDSTRKEDLKSIVAYMAKNSDLTKPVAIRYVPDGNMQHFSVPSTKYYPYGESIFDSSQFTAKVLIALETALAVHRLSRSTEKRKIAVELGLPRDAKKLIEKLKEEFRKRKISLDSFGTIDTIPSMITTFEDVYIPQKDGKAFVDISTFNEGNVDIRGKVDELKLLRDQLVADLGVPPAFIGIEENSVVKNTLTEENVLFARTIVGHQKYFTDQIFSLVYKTMYIINPEEAITLEDDVIISLQTPKSLQFEREARYMGELANLIEALVRLGIPKEFLKKKYLPDIDWNEIKKYEIDSTIEKELGTESKDDESGGMGGGLGGPF